MSATSSLFVMISNVKHGYQVWSPSIGESFVCFDEEKNVHDRKAVVVTCAEGFAVGHLPREISSVCFHFIKYGGQVIVPVGVQAYHYIIPWKGQFLTRSCRMQLKVKVIYIRTCNDTNYEYNAPTVIQGTATQLIKTIQKASLLEWINYISVNSILLSLVLDGQVQPGFLNSASIERGQCGWRLTNWHLWLPSLSHQDAKSVVCLQTDYYAVSDLPCIVVLIAY